MPDTPRYYALDSLPDLLGPRQFTLLCNAMGFDPALEPDLTGHRFALSVEHAAANFIQARRRRETELDAQRDARFARMLREAPQEPRAPASASPEQPSPQDVSAETPASSPDRSQA